ncbi:MAG: glycosyltransferase [Gemmatimonadaceae bacterium]
MSVVLPVRNEAGKISQCIEGILEQTVAVREIVVLDSGSTDGTLQLLAHYPKVRVISIQPGEFNHGSTRNVGVRAAEGAEYVLLTVGDARAADDQWIERLVDGFTDERVAGVCGQQVVPHEKTNNPVDWFRPVSAPGVTRYQFETVAAFERLSARRKRQICGWDDVTAMYRRDLLLAMPFQPVSYAEDIVWAHTAIRAGHAIVYMNAARVYHCHRESPDFTFRRALTTSYFRYRCFSDVPDMPNTLRNLVSAGRTLLRERSLSGTDRMHWLFYNARNQLAQRQAVSAFRHAAGQGDAAVHALHQQYCGDPPIPVKDTPAANFSG